MFDFKSANLSNLSTADESAFIDQLDGILMPTEETCILSTEMALFLQVIESL